jgi:hypothetical protein
MNETLTERMSEGSDKAAFIYNDKRFKQS